MPVLTEPVSTPLKWKKVLIVDDIADTGKSLKLVMDHVLQKATSEVKVATLYCKPWSIVKPDYYEKETELWVVFPWDIKETIRKKFENRGKKSIAELASDLREAGMSKALASRFLKEMAGRNP
jgi:hypothetical protein